MFPGLRNATNYSGSRSTSSEIHPKSGYIATRAELVRATIGQGRRTRLRFIYIYSALSKWNRANDTKCGEK